MGILKNKSGVQFFNVIIITLVHHIHDIYTSFLAALQTVIIETFAINNRLFGLLSVIQRLPTLLNPFFGILAEKIRIKYLVIVTPTITAISICFMGNMSDYVRLAVLVLISGMSSAVFHVPTPVMMKEVSGKKPGLGMGFYMFGGESARTLGPIVAIAAVDMWGFDGLFRLIPAGVLSSLILFLRFRKVDLRKKFPESGPSEGTHFEVFKKYFPILGTIALFSLIRGGMKSVFTYYLVGYLEYDLGWSKMMAGVGLSTIYISGTIGSLLFGMGSDYIGKRTTILIVSIISPFLFFLFIHSGDAVSLPLLALNGFFLLAQTPVFLSIVNTLKSEHSTFLNGIYMTGIFLMSAIATMLTGYGLDYLSVELTFKISAFIALFAIPLVLLLPKNVR